MSKHSSLKDSHTDLQRLKSMNDENIDLSEIPEIDEQQVSESAARFNRMALSKRKVRINILLDETIVAYFKTLASGRGYQTLINEALKQSMVQDDLEKTIRRVIREELQRRALKSIIYYKRRRE